MPCIDTVHCIHPLHLFATASHVDAKNKALAAAGAYVPSSFADMGPLLKALYSKLVKEGTIVPEAEGPVPKMPIDYATAQKSGLIRKPSNFISTICDDRGEELLYAGIPVSKVFKEVC